MSTKVNTIEQNLLAFKKLEERHKAGELSDREVATQIQKHLDLEHRLDSDYESPRVMSSESVF